MFRNLILSFFCLCICFSAAEGESSQGHGWVSLFDGKSLDGWKASEREGVFSVKDGAIVVNGKRSHLFYVGAVENANFKDFEFKADVMTMPGANSGIYIHTEYQQDGWPRKGYESQVNNSHSDRQKTGGLYDTARVNPAPAKDEQWFTHHIIVRGKKVVVKVDGKVVVDYTEAEDVNFAGWPGRKLSSGTFALQGHDPGSVVYFKNIMVKPLVSEPEWVEIFNGKDLAGWELINGTAKYEVQDGVIVGTTVRGSPNSFLCTKKHYSDFILEFEFKVDRELNSGVQIRSNSFKNYRNGRVHGYQVDIDPSPRAWSAGVYDEAGRGWLDDLKDNEAARKAFKQDQWNHVRVEAVGDSIKTRINDVPAADLEDSMTAAGFIGLQVHSSSKEEPLQVRWRNIRIKDLSAGCEPIKVAVVTGGHDFEIKPFFEMFDSFGGIEYVHVELKDDSEIFEDVRDLQYDVIVLYNMTQKISAKRRANFVELLKDKGVGLVAIHHSMGAFQDWEEYKKIVGGRFYRKEMTESGVTHKASGYKHGVEFAVKVADKDHPVGQGLSDFTLSDEVYNGCGFEADNHIILTTGHADSDKTICWVRRYGKANVCYIMPGHGASSYGDSNYRRLVSQAIKWCGNKN